jgi:uncharacterized protein YigA (DUF484 family)
MTTDEFFAEAKRLNLRMLGTPEETRAALDLKDAEIASLREEVANLVVRVDQLRKQAEEGDKWRERAKRLLDTLDECLGRERARNEIRRQEQEALEL